MEMSAPDWSASMKPCERDVSLLHVDSAEHGVANLGAGLGDGTKVVNEVSLGHTNTGVDDGKDFVLLVGDDFDNEVLARVKDCGVGEGRVADLVEGIGRVGDEFTEENLLVRVEGVCGASRMRGLNAADTNKAGTH